jgi:hypothetical protein
MAAMTRIDAIWLAARRLNRGRFVWCNGKQSVGSGAVTGNGDMTAMRHTGKQSRHYRGVKARRT